MTRGRVPTYARQANPRQSLTISRQTFRDLDRFIRDMEGNSVRVLEYGDLLVRYVGLAVIGYAQVMARGPVSPTKRSVPSLAFRIPVQRITGRYFASWHMKRLSLGAWLVYNDSREAFIIEEGLFRGRRVPRRILKYSVIKALRLARSTNVGYRLAHGAFGSRRNERGQFQSFASSIVAGPKGRLPG